MKTEPLYLEDPYRRDADAEVVECAGGSCALSRTVFFPGGGGQPHDRGHLLVRGELVAVAGVRQDGEGRIWHAVGRDLPPGEPVRAVLDWPYRHALMRHHGLMHVVNTVVRDRFGGVITGVQLGAQRSRIDFRLPSFAREQIPELEGAVNEAIARALPITSSVVSGEELRRRPELVRTLNVAPPVVGGVVRVVEIVGFDVQACGGTHVHGTAEIGRARVVKFDNKGKDNKRFYWQLEDGMADGRPAPG